MNLFFELSPTVISKDRYFAAYNKARPMHGVFPPRYHSVAASSDRIWLEDESGIKFVKHRWQSIDDVQVDLEEFMMIKLKSKPV